MTIKYNGELLEIPMEEAVILAQKGMNYDRILERLEKLEKAPEMELLNTLSLIHIFADWTLRVFVLLLITLVLLLIVMYLVAPVFYNRTYVRKPSIGKKKKLGR